MAKSILISIKPRFVADILNHKKTLEIRKSFPKCDLPIDVYIYCTKEKNKNLYMSMFHGNYQVAKNIDHKHHILNGKVVAKFTLNKVEHFEYETCSRDISGYWLDNGKVFENKGTCLTADELWNYIKGKNGYAWHIDNLVPFDKPKEISEFCTTNLDKQLPELFDNSIQLENGTWVKPLTRAPESYCYVEI